MIKELLPHQKDILVASRKADKGINIAPTGTGKTIAQAAIVQEELSKPGSQIAVVKTPRIGLTNQVASVYASFLSENSTPFESLLVHSGEAVEFEVDGELDFESRLEVLENLKYASVDVTTSTNELVQRLNRAQELQEDFIIFTTYYSIEKIYQKLNQLNIQIDIEINDEAHYLVRQDFNYTLDLFSPKRQYFFTATPVVGESLEGRGMNNVEKFGEIIYTLSQQEAVDKGLILPVKPVLIKSGVIATENEVERGVGQLVEEAFYNLKDEYTQLGAKLLVASRGSKQIRTFLDSEEYKDLLRENVNILTVHSNQELNTFNGREITRKEFNILKDKLGSNPDVDLIIVHYDILAEGIDIQGLTGVLILRKMKLAKFLQTIGRVLRVYRDNPQVKPYGLVMFPDIADSDLVVAFTDMILAIRKQGYVPSDLLTDLLTSGITDDTETGLGAELSITSSIDLELYTEDLIYSDPTF